ncbi:inorganic phosphate transporter [Mixta tenebrionis]|uniref:Phosphate transporter n=1 Tax=Mixta tenebrionis TaxID=2562439 RepID=A0A506VFR0_9GAMM|nr:inorganic phosphate transporter [Mixta tenebrionis]TPW44667.1 inorganic phosphate transporter [Mixta tenebrionis]
MSEHRLFTRCATRFPALYTPRCSRQRRVRIALTLLLLASLAWMMQQLSPEIRYAVDGGLPLLSALLLCGALLLALAFIFINGMHDTANAVTTVIYTGTLSPTRAVLISAVANMTGVALASGVVAWSVMSLLPPEGLITLDTRHGYALIYALLLSAVGWNFTSWYMAIPCSSSHALLGAMLGAGCASSLLHDGQALNGVDWRQAERTGWALLLAPLLGFLAAGLLLRLIALLPACGTPGTRPPLWLRGMLMLTSSGVSFAHGANDGQKGMGLIMVILLIALPGAFALNRALPESELASLTRLTAQAQARLPAPENLTPAQTPLQHYPHQQPGRSDKTLATPGVMAGAIYQQLSTTAHLNALTPDERIALRLRMALTANMVRQLLQEKESLAPGQRALLRELAAQLDHAAKMIPWWVKIVTALTLALGTLTGWQRIAITIGERTGAAPLSAAQGASSELVAMTALGVAEPFGLPISTTQVLACGVAGSMAASGSPLQSATLKRIGLVWLLTLPACALLSALLYTLLLAL